MMRSVKNEMNGAACLPTITTVVLAVCLLLGQGFRAPNFASQFFGNSLENYIVNSAPIDSAFISAERSIRLQTKAPRRQVPFGDLPLSSMLEVPGAFGQRTLVEALCPASTIPAHPNDRAPPLLTE